MKYTVHVFAVARVPLEIEAASQEEAVSKAREDFSLQDYLAGSAVNGVVYDSEEITEFFVDEEGDEEHENSKTYNADGKLRNSIA
jgi:hypothetical protein